MHSRSLEKSGCSTLMAGFAKQGMVARPPFPRVVTDSENSDSGGEPMNQTKPGKYAKHLLASLADDHPPAENRDFEADRGSLNVTWD